MLKNIRLHVEKDEKKQALLEQKLAGEILRTHNDNINSFARNIPSLLPLVNSPQLQSQSLFCNKFGEINVVDYGVGRTLYNFHPSQEVSEQVAQFNRHAPYVSIVSQKESTNKSSNDEESSALDFKQFDSYCYRQTLAPSPKEMECLVILGCGLGMHILELMELKQIKYLIIYEPELQYFQCSALVAKWHDIFDLAKKNGTQIFLQIEKDGRDLISDINELNDNVGIDGFYLYKHYNHPIFNALELELTSKAWPQIVKNGITFNFQEDYNQYTPTWTPCIDLPAYETCRTDSDLYKKNLKALKQYFPDIYQEYAEYQPKVWVPTQTPDGQVNIVKRDSLTPWYSDAPKDDCLHNYENYNEQPNKDGLVLGYKGTKLAHYIHYQFVKETEELLKQAEEETGALPEKIVSIIMFGLGVGYQLERLLDTHTVEKLFVCEPNPDFFYASLFAIDWQTIFETVEQSGSRIYLNIGDDGTNLFRDLLGQFYSIGPYILNSTYFYQSYYNASLNSAISQLREQLQVVISMGEYFDHAYYGIAHTKEGMRRKIPVLTSNPSEKLSYDDKEVPVFIVGNGPSLDSSIEAIKEWQQQCIVVSCGTALQALHRHGITPDFHAEIEQNRSTFDWAVLIGDLEYLKNITLISCNGIHPDTCDLYKDVMIAFKEGESSTVSALNVLGRENYQVLKHAFPTVSNFACDLFSSIGFTSVYLIGVDLGFVDVKHHHSKSSGYFQEDGQETYDYSEKNNTSLIVPGNFRPTVNTKHEFKVSRQIIEQVTAAKPKSQAFYNCSDGAKIHGTLPIRPDELLIVATNEQKQQSLNQLNSIVFSSDGLENYIEDFEKQFSNDLLLKELGAIETLLEKEITCAEDVQFIINKQKEMLFTSYKNGKSLLFYYLYGTVNYANAVLSKINSRQRFPNSTQVNLQLFQEQWLKTLTQINLTVRITNTVDGSSFNDLIRERTFLRLNYKQEKLVLVTDSLLVKKVVLFLMESIYSWITPPIVLTSKESQHYSSLPDYCIYFLAERQHKYNISGQISTINVIDTFDISSFPQMNFTYLITPKFDNKTVSSCIMFTSKIALLSCFSAHRCKIIFPKYWSCDTSAFTNRPINLQKGVYTAFDYRTHICLHDRRKTGNNISSLGSRGKPIDGELKMEHLLYTIVSRKKLAHIVDVYSQKINS